MHKDGHGARVTAWLAALGVVTSALVACTNVADGKPDYSGPASNVEGSQPAPSGDQSTGPSTESESEAPSTADLVDGIDWSGTFTMTVEKWNYCGSPPGELVLTLADTYTLEESFSFSTAAPTEVSDATIEDNPFYMSAGTDPEDPGPLTLALFSAALLEVESTPDEPYLQQYWDLAYDDGELTGELVEDGRELGAAFNGFFDEDELIPCKPQLGVIAKAYTLAEGTTLVADLGNDTMTMLVEGRSYDEARRFRIEASATRGS